MSQRICSIEGCGAPYYGKGFCNRHWQQWHKRGDPLYRYVRVPVAPSPCIVEDCTNLGTHARGMCSKHYGRWHRHGDPAVTLKSLGEPLAWLRQAIAVRDRNECWPWPFERNALNYGRVRFQGPKRQAHAVALILDGHPRPPVPNDNALHSCDNPPCVNPAHLRWGTDLDNSADQRERDRQTRLIGERNPSAKLTEDDVRAIRKDPRLQKVIAAEYGVAQTVVSAIKRRAKWRHVA